jgi:trehalose 6-phosphate phosphatase
MMQIPPPSPSLEWCLFLDFDGTLIELTDSPVESIADPELTALLGMVTERLGGAVALVSGRSIEYLDALFDPLRLPAAGLHGVERRRASGGTQGANFVDTGLDRIRAAVQTLAAVHPGTLIEDKGRTIAVHFRLAPSHEASIRESLDAIAAPLGPHYHVQEGNMVLEIMPRGFNKGNAVAEFMKEPPFTGRRPVFIGDDLTDQGGFRVVEGQGGVSIAVGDRVRGQYRVDDSAAVRRWLQGIAALQDSQRG